LPKNSLRSLIFILALLVGGCGSGKDLGLARAAVTQLHAQIDNEQFADIYWQADDAFRKTSTISSPLFIKNLGK